MDRYTFPSLGVVFAFAVSFIPASYLSADEPDLAAVEVSTALSESSNSELEVLGGDTCNKCDCVRSACCCGHYVDWSKVPESIRPMPRPGNFPIPRTGCGFYSL